MNMKGRCPACSHWVRIRPSGLVSKHQEASLKTCSGTGKMPTEAKT